MATGVKTVTWCTGTVIGLLLAAGGVCAASSPGGEADATDMGPVLFGLAVVLLAARVGGHIAVRVGQPAVLGELGMGMLLGNLGLVGYHGLGFLATNPTLDVLAEIGVVLLLFGVGLESKLQEMRRVGASSLVVATLGVVAPFFLGWGVARWFLPAASSYVHVFVGATLCATSVGITARVFQDLRRVETPEARIVLGAAVIDDVQGLVVLAIVQGIIVAAGGGAPLSPAGVGVIVLKATGFLVGGVLVGLWVAPRMFHAASLLRSDGVLLGFGLVFCFLFAYAAKTAGLAPIVGAFAAGLILEEGHYHVLAEREGCNLSDLLDAPMTMLVPIFFVLMGARVNLGVFAMHGVLGFAAALTLAAILGKQVCGLGVLQRGVSRLVVGLGMIPRGEVGLICASIGAKLVLNGRPVVDNVTFSAVVIMVMVTTLCAPPLLKWALNRGNGARPAYVPAPAPGARGEGRKGR